MSSSTRYDLTASRDKIRSTTVERDYKKTPLYVVLLLAMDTDMFTSLSYAGMTIIVSHDGAELVSLKKWHREYLYQKTTWYWQRQSPILFPIVGALSWGVYRYQGKTYTLSQHGFARDRLFECSERESDSLTFSLWADKESQILYPFLFELSVTYTLRTDTLEVRYHVKNTGWEVMYFSIGGHPAVALTWDIAEYSLLYPEDQIVTVDRLTDGLLSHAHDHMLDGWRLALSEDIFSPGALIFRCLRSRELTLYRRGEKVLTLDRGELPHFAIWRERGAPYLCLEPWQGYADRQSGYGDITEKEGMCTLLPDSTYNWAWSMIV
jgi:galactose mutarotase-like enzyme